MALGLGMSCIKYLLFCFNLLFAISGLIILIVGIKAEISSSPYIDLTDENFYTSAPVVLIIVGVIVFIVAFFGCCGAVKENHCMIVSFSVFLLVIFVAELAVGIAGYVKNQDLETSIVRHLNATIKEYPTDPNLACCGIYGVADWKTVVPPKIPDSCCSGQEIAGTGVATPCTETSEFLHKSGCLTKVVSHMQEIAYVLGGVGLGIAMLLGVIFACCLARSIRGQYETV
ncbi:hypothetical protein MSG28_003623 [Choristoneura fumiferana]|uniref:Uncharacterized protein n=2 Tax=Choristoneura fumiferana TaxID=7141 RepID=A0ACC0KGD6_CHOFU|nr:hypothetical protein MSG28_003623 [Choristoneura fumiferana]KAI8435285.1 hypothetical protein MSG28_003623 [Choristoneura fumiferana]